MAKQYETVIGLEVHVELATSTKIFCGCSTKFGAAPNTHTCPVCTGMPGSLPVLNGKVVEYALKLADALSRLSGTELPKAVEEIRTAPVLHDTVVEISEMKEAVKAFLGI